MCRVALADRGVRDGEIGLIRIVADQFGLSPSDTSRILASAGIVSRSEDRASAEHRSSSARAPLSERDAHLKTLGLKPGANQTAIRRAWRRLAAAYHPDKLVSKNLPPGELEKAEDMMQNINLAYDWLKAND
ncbi:MAG: DnaJ domain-containing protein [Pseudomonadota bacterium]